MDDRVRAHFDVLFGSLKDYQAGFFDGGFKFTGFLVLVIGWLLTSKEARAFLANNGRVRGLCATAICAGAFIYAAVSWRVYQASQVAFQDLVTLDYLPVAAYADHRIDTTALLLLLAQNALLTLVACYFMLHTGSKRVLTP